MDFTAMAIEYYKDTIEYKQNFTIDYRCDTFVVDFYLPSIQTFVIFNRDNWAIEVYKDIKALCKLNGKRAIIIPIYDIHTEAEFNNYLYKSVNPGSDVYA